MVILRIIKHALLYLWYKTKELSVALFMLCLLASCIRTPEQASKRIHKLMERFPTAIDSTVVTTRDTIRDTTYIDRVIHDTVRVEATYKAIDEAVDGLKITDTVVVYNIKHQLHRLCTIEGLMDTMVFNTNNIQARVWAVGNDVHLTATIINTTIKEEKTKIDFLKDYKVPLTKDHWFLAFCGACIVWLLTLFVKFK